ncbi:SAC3/GANP/Nin1/mts3/eIF-3 p25 family-domain-containing protein [Mrakia frigida]|uniref:proteasome regulatory particle lid subunit RPN12 n=1 Tax=Mrakia frigida TaxID=29902 RepID=UPI003FCC1C89
MSLASSFSSLQSSFDSNDLASVGQQLPAIKVLLTQHNLLYPSGSSNSEQDLIVARSILEIGAFYSIRSAKIPAFERYMAQLDAFYSTPLLPPSPSHPTLLSLHLLSLLSTSRTSAFHTLLETLPVQLLSADGVREIIELERGLMEGSYNKVWRMAKGLMDKDGGKGLGGLAELLVGSIRNEISLSFLTSYTSLPIPSAQQLLFLPSPSEVVAFAQKKGWTISPSSQTIFFPTPSALGGAGVGAAAESGGMKGLIEESLGYARELEAIV